MSKIRYLQVIFISFLLPAMVMGCLALVVGTGAAGGVLYYKGSTKADLDAQPDKVIVARNKAFMDLNWKKISSSSSKTDGKSTATTGTGKKVDVTVTQKTEKISEIDIRIGTMGDETLSQTLLDKIKRYL